MRRYNIKKHNQNRFNLTSLSSFFLSLFVILSLLISDGFQLLRLCSIIGFAISAFFSSKIYHPNSSYWFLVYSIIFVVTIGLLRGILEFGNWALFDSKVPILYFAFFAIITLFISHDHIKVIDYSIPIGGILISLYFFYMFLGTIGFSHIKYGDFLNQGYSFDIFNGKVKVYANHLSILVFVFPFMLTKTILKHGSQKLNIITLSITSLSMFISLRRGVILSGIIGIIFTLLLLIIYKKINFSIRKLAVLILGLVILLALYVNIAKADPQAIINELLSASNFDTNASNIIRKEQTLFFLEKIEEKPFLGYGLGAHDYRYIRDYNYPTRFELGYFAMIYKVGFLGFIANFIFFLWGLFKAKNIIKHSGNYYLYVAPVLAGWISIIIYHASNPIFSGFSYLFFYFYLFYLVNQTKTNQ